MLLRLVPENTKIPFMRFRKIAMVFSILLVIASGGYTYMNGLNFGIDFRGGVTIEIETEGPADVEAIRASVSRLGLGDVAAQEFGAPNDILIRIERQAEGGQQTAIDSVLRALDADLGQSYTVRRTEVVGPKVSGELVQKGITAVLLAVGAIMIYIWFRFEWQFGLGAVVSLVHDVALTIGFFSLTGLEFNLSIVAAILTIVGYSLNDTVVVFDRIRENLRKFRKPSILEIIDQSLNETLARTLMTSITTLLALLALFFLGGEVIRGFTAAMIWGVVIGTYSSIFVASPVLNALNVSREAFIPQEAKATP
ncbi:MAG: protein translocase subunit SecF [Pseudomonadota bacterium]